jgi:hypothetical protein
MVAQRLLHLQVHAQPQTISRLPWCYCYILRTGNIKRDEAPPSSQRSAITERICDNDANPIGQLRIDGQSKGKIRYIKVFKNSTIPVFMRDDYGTDFQR